MRKFKILSALLCYPDDDLRAAIPEIAAALAEDMPPAQTAALHPLILALADGDLYDLQADYVDLFDRGRRLSLHLFEHVHGESRDRGQAMVDLAQVYEQGGLLLAPGELPDYLPLFLEFLSTRPPAEAAGLLADIVPILTSMHGAVQARGTRYAAIFATLLHIAGAATIVVAPAARAAEELEALDAEWEESVVKFGPGEDISGCSPDRMRTRLRAAGRDARQAASTLGA